MKCIILFKLVDLSQSVDMLAVFYKSIQFSNTNMSGTRRPLKSYTRDRPLNFRYNRFENANLCVVAVWEEYFTRTRNIPRNKDQVFVSHSQPFKEIGTEQIAKDTLQAMKSAGIDIDRFKSHSTHMAVVSKALNLGASVNDVMRAGRWKSKSVFDKFYNQAKHMDIGKLVLSNR